MAWFEHEMSRIFYEEEGSGNSVLLLPGFTLSISDMQFLRVALAPRYRVVLADLPGSGKSGPQPRTFIASYYQDDARSFLALLEHLGAAPAHLVGFSDGGDYALLMAALQPASVRSVVVWGAAGRVAVQPDVIAAFSQVIDNPPAPLEGYSDFLKATYGEENARAMTQSAANAWEAIRDAGGDISRTRAGEIACPALLITGENDFMAPPAAVSDMADAMQRAEFVEVKGASHSVHHEQPDWLVKTIVDWLAER